MDSIQHWGEARFTKCVVEIAVFMSFRIVSADTNAFDPSIEFVASICNMAAVKESDTSRRMLLNMVGVGVGVGEWSGNYIATSVLLEQDPQQMIV